MYGIDIMDSWLYGEGDPFAYVKQLDIYKELRDAVESDYYEKLVQEISAGQHTCGGCCRCTGKGTDCKTGGRDGKRNWQILKAGLSEEQVKEMVEKQQNCKEFQETPSTQEELEKIPMLTRGGYHKEMQTDLQQRAFFWQHQSSVA